MAVIDLRGAERCTRGGRELAPRARPPAGLAATRSTGDRGPPRRPLLVASLGAVAVGVALPLSPLGPLLGFAPLPLGFLLVLAGIVVVYLVLVDVSKRVFFAGPDVHLPHVRRRGRPHRVHRRAARFSVPTSLSG